MAVETTKYFLDCATVKSRNEKEGTAIIGPFSPDPFFAGDTSRRVAEKEADNQMKKSNLNRVYQVRKVTEIIDVVYETTPTTQMLYTRDRTIRISKEDGNG